MQYDIIGMLLQGLITSVILLSLNAIILKIRSRIMAKMYADYIIDTLKGTTDENGAKEQTKH